MAQYIKPLNTQDGEQRYEVVMLAAGKDGSVVEATNPLPVTNGTGSSLSVSLGGTNLDAFGRLRTSNTFTLFDSAFRYSDNGKFDTALTSSGMASYNSTFNSVDLTVTGNGDQVVRESKRVFPYQPGKSLLILTTFTMEDPVADLRQRVGYFGANNGIFLEIDGEDVFIVKRNNGTDTRKAQAEWSENTLLSTLDLSKSQIFFIDIEWLGVGTVRTGFVIDGEFVVAHKFHHANMIDGTYMQTAALPVRYEITSTGAAGTLHQICASVMSEGGYEGTSQYYFATNAPTAGLDLGSAGTLTPIASIRLKSSQSDAIILPAEIDIVSLSNQNVMYKLIVNGTLTSANFADHAVSQCQVDTSATAISGGTILQQGFITNTGRVSVGGLDNFNFQLGRTISGTSDIITLAALGFSNNVKVASSLGWFQLT